MATLSLKRTQPVVEPRYNFKTTGKIVYDPPRPGMKKNTDRWVIVSVDRDITRYYRWWVKRHYHIDLCEPSWNAHVSVVRGERIKPEYQELWKRLHGKTIEVEYGHTVKQVDSKPHFWYVSAHAPEIDQIRGELGLQTNFAYHLTIGRTYNEADYVRPSQLLHGR